LNIIRFYEKHGEEATKEAFGVDRKLISKWRKRLKGNGGRLEALMPYSTRPKRTRKSKISHEIVDFIRGLRERYPRLGKEKIKPLLDEYCKDKGLKTVSEPTIGNIIKRHNFFFQKTGRIYHNPDSKWADNSKHRQKRTKVKHPPRHEELGHIVSDTIERITDGIKDYFFSAIDATGKFALTLNYKRQNSKNMKDFYERFKMVYPCEIKVWQSDNGSENLGEFDKALKKDGIPQLFSYPRCPKINAHIERYNRTIQEEFIDNHLDIIHDKRLFNQALADYLIFYNTKRIHKSLNKKTPIDFIIEKGEMSHMSVAYTGYCKEGKN
ncbi:MAG: integrase core domain-containing protein, partial [Thermodesulfovibrionales bacterium]|nr:integrase core domain-containing protein [Thermodesulfovibrionales bacterium]